MTVLLVSRTPELLRSSRPKNRMHGGAANHSSLIPLFQRESQTARMATDHALARRDSTGSDAIVLDTAAAGLVCAMHSFGMLTLVDAWPYGGRGGRVLLDPRFGRQDGVGLRLPLEGVDAVAGACHPPEYLTRPRAPHQMH